MSDVAIGPMEPSELRSVLDLLERLGLPEAGLARHGATVLVARAAGRIVGTAALEVFDDEALLRSVGVASERQGTGLGAGLTREALALARRLGVARIYLLTTTAERFFPRFGFTAIARESIGASVQRSEEFQSACPASAVAMEKVL